MISKVRLFPGKQLRLAFSVHSPKNMTFKSFCREVKKAKKLLPSNINFDESFYLDANPDVKESVSNGRFYSGYVHYLLVGQHEKRIYSTLELSKKLSIRAQIPDEELFRPVHNLPLDRFNMSYDYDSRKDVGVIVIPHLQRKLFFAGYVSFFNDMSKLRNLYSEVIIITLFKDVEPDLIEDKFDTISVVYYQDVKSLPRKPKSITCFDQATYFYCKNVFNMPDKTVYYCQDFEAGFYPFGSLYIRAQRALLESKNIILSTKILYKDLVSRGFLKDANIYITSPHISVIEGIELDKNKKIFCYFRPEKFNTRNLPELIIEFVEDFCEKYDGYELYLVGTNGTCYSYTIRSNLVFVINKLDKMEYLNLLKSVDLVVALIYSSHPGVIAYQAAASGIPTVTNTFFTRGKEEINLLSTNIVPYNPVRDDLLGIVEQALTIKKGEKNFNDSLYSGNETKSLVEFYNKL
tara:strand:- start:4178 stop:5566 length:1389 start_codon:yes stop_codon:yes gene_type:complete